MLNFDNLNSSNVKIIKVTKKLNMDSPPRKQPRTSIFFDSPNIDGSLVLKLENQFAGLADSSQSAIENVDFVVYTDLDKSLEVS